MKAREDKAILALLEQPTIERAAEQAGVSTAQLRRWLNRDDFKRRLESARDSVFEVALASISSRLALAVETLAACCAEDQPPTVRVSASRALLEIAVKAQERSAERDTEHRLAALEQVVRNRGNNEPAIAYPS